MKLKLKQRVVKTSGDYFFTGIITAIFYKLKPGTALPDKNKPRYIVENPDGVCHIFGASQLEPADEISRLMNAAKPTKK